MGIPALNMNEREFIRDKYVKLLPHNLTADVENAKSFGGKKALEHLKNIERKGTLFMAS
jgi:hypothetical protein